MGQTKELAVTLGALKQKHLDYHTKNTSNDNNNNNNRKIQNYVPFSYLDNEGIMTVALNLVFAISSRYNKN